MNYFGIKTVNFKELVGERVYVMFMCKDVAVGNQKNGRQFVSITMKQNEVEENAKLFDATASDIEKIKAGKVYVATVDIKPYDKSSTGYACVIPSGMIEENTSVSSEQFLEWTNGVNEALVGIANYVSDISMTWYGNITTLIMNEVWQKFSYWSAAKSLHHEQLGGLAVHTFEVVRMGRNIADTVCRIYGDNFINIPLLTSASVLHDVGKVNELNTKIDCGVTEYSIEASLTSHIMSGISMIDSAALRLGLCTNGEEPEELTLLKHVVAAHHGKKEWGSPVCPSVPEANILHMADEISAQMYRYNKEFSKLDIEESSSSWINGELYSVYKDSTKL